MNDCRLVIPYNTKAIRASSKTKFCQGSHSYPIRVFALKLQFGSYDPKQGVFAIQIAERGDPSIDRETEEW